MCLSIHDIVTFLLRGELGGDFTAFHQLSQISCHFVSVPPPLLAREVTVRMHEISWRRCIHIRSEKGQPHYLCSEACGWLWVAISGKPVQLGGFMRKNRAETSCDSAHFPPILAIIFTRGTYTVYCFFSTPCIHASTLYIRLLRHERVQVWGINWFQKINLSNFKLKITFLGTVIEVGSTKPLVTSL